MSLVTHFFISWLAANSAKLQRRDRALVTASGAVHRKRFGGEQDAG
jgi:hypothetical protein